ncbi:DUF3572 family protein [Pelagibacterium lentulum]|uniref:DUF3572 domain-containing protein n=1 Tax=Pelagibacterium lentulum TaxID=2029865 RepID=A0A916RFP3_9HYPH|nr:DUF3572 family protein [Pelagibacterium lentulum]GGA51989.1 hypothetical protein GCM10011499_22550 [Pelagibacterium lentulum]
MRDTIESAEISTVAEQCLSWLVSDVEELERFMLMAGYTPQTLREALGSSAFEAGLVDYFGRNEPLLLAMCANAGMPVERVMRVWHRMNRQD